MGSVERATLETSLILHYVSAICFYIILWQWGKSVALDKNASGLDCLPPSHQGSVRK